MMIYSQVMTMLGCYLLKCHIPFLFLTSRPFEEELIITQFELANVQEKQLSMERLFSPDSIYLS